MQAMSVMLGEMQRRAGAWSYACINKLLKEKAIQIWDYGRMVDHQWEELQMLSHFISVSDQGPLKDESQLSNCVHSI